MVLRMGFVLIFVLGIVVLFTWWHSSFGFVATDGRWWQWLVSGIKSGGSVPREVLIPVYVVAVGILLGYMVLLLLGSRLSAGTISGRVRQAQLHGSAQWATLKDVKRMGLLSEKGVVVGGIAKGSKGVTVLRHDGPEHVLAFAPTRSGKGVGLVLPTLLSWSASAVILDIKGENWALTSGWRASQGHKIYKFDPTEEHGGSRFNPLNEIRMNTPMEIQDIQNVAVMIVDPEGKGMDDFWVGSGFGWMTGVIAHVLHKTQQNEQRTANLKDVSDFLSQPADDFEEVLQQMQVDATLWPSDIATLVSNAAQTMINRAGPERSGVQGSAAKNVMLYADPIIAGNTSTSDFALSDLMNDDVPSSLYLVVPPTDIDRLRPLMRMMVSQMISRLVAKMEFAGGASVAHYKHRLLLMLDEFTSLGKLEKFEAALAFIAGYGLKAYVIVQDLAQLQKAYGKEEAIISNCHVRIAYAPNKPETAKVLSDMAGKTTIIQRKRSRSGQVGQLGSVSDSLSETARPLLTADECMQLPGMVTSKKAVKKAGDMLIFPAGARPIYGRQPLYFQDAQLLKRAQMPPVVNTGRSKKREDSNPTNMAGSNDNEEQPKQIRPRKRSKHRVRSKGMGR